MSGPAPKPKITCKYSCNVCGLVNREVQVYARESHESVIDWMNEQVITSVAVDHALRRCSATAFQNLMIPFDEDKDEWIGQARQP